MNENKIVAAMLISSRDNSSYDFDQLYIDYNEMLDVLNKKSKEKMEVTKRR